jgi:hypothetical protein
VFILQNLISEFTGLFVLNKSALYNYEIWRFVTSVFLHENIVHLLYNLFALALFGFILEKLIGSKRFLIVFFASGIIANLIAVNFYNSSLGVSGAIYGILGCLAVLRPLMMIWAFGFPMPMFIAAIVWVGAGILGVFMPSNVGDIAHLSGIGIGFLIGLILRLTRKKQNPSYSYKIEIPDSYMNEWENRYMKE